MLWDFSVKALASQLVLLFLFGLLIKTFSPAVRDFLSNHWGGTKLIVWASSFTFVLLIGGFILGLIVATTTTFLLGLWVKLREKISRPS